MGTFDYLGFTTNLTTSWSGQLEKPLSERGKYWITFKLLDGQG
jgi:hypothetical protein